MSNLLTFLIFLIFICLLPGRALLYFSKIYPSIIETFTISVFLGLVFFEFFNFLFRIFGLPLYTVYVIYLLVDLLFICRRLKNPEGITNFLKPTLTSANKIFIIIYATSLFISFYIMSHEGFLPFDSSLWFRPVILCSLLGLLVFILGRKLFKSEGKASVATVITYFILDTILLL